MDVAHNAQLSVRQPFFEDYSYRIGTAVRSDTPPEEISYSNAATCPDCGAGMVRLGTCFSCPSCGFGSCAG